jgi:hypothetical protein
VSPLTGMASRLARPNSSSPPTPKVRECLDFGELDGALLGNRHRSGWALGEDPARTA